MLCRSTLSLLLVPLLLTAADKKPVAPASMGNENIEIEAIPIVDKATVLGMLGHDPGFPLIVLEVKFTPKGDNNKVALYRDDFTLLSAKDGQRSQPLAPSQIAGKGAMVVANGQTGRSGGGIMSGQPQGPIWGGYPGSPDRPRRVGGDDQMVGAIGENSDTKVTVDEGGKEKDNPLLVVLKKKVLPEGEYSDTVTGQLYFILDGKLPKTKDLSLIYKGQAGRLILEFK